MPTTSNTYSYESSVQEGIPIECYKFTNDNMEYLYTSRRSDLSLEFIENGLKRTETYYAEYIKRSELIPGSQGSSTETTITVSKENPVAKLYQTAPPETAVMVRIIRLHASDLSKRDVIFYGRVTQASFEDSECSFTVVLESWLTKEFPNGLYQYTCNNVLFDKNCRLLKDDYKEKVFLDKVIDEINVYSKDFEKHEDGYYENGRMYFDGHVRMIESHKGNLCKLKYPFHLKPRNEVVVLPGCDKIFKTCVKRFKNADNYTGFPYCPPTDAEKNPTGTGTYWMDGNIVIRDTKGFVHTMNLG